MTWWMWVAAVWVGLVAAVSVAVMLAAPFLPTIPESEDEHGREIL